MFWVIVNWSENAAIDAVYTKFYSNFNPKVVVHIIFTFGSIYSGELHR